MCRRVVVAPRRQDSMRRRGRKRVRGWCREQDGPRRHPPGLPVDQGWPIRPHRSDDRSHSSVLLLWCHRRCDPEDRGHGRGQERRRHHASVFPVGSGPARVRHELHQWRRGHGGHDGRNRTHRFGLPGCGAQAVGQRRSERAAMRCRRRDPGVWRGHERLRRGSRWCPGLRRSSP